MHSRFVLQFLAPIALVSLLLLAVGATAAWYVHRQNKESAEFLGSNLKAVVASQRLVVSLQDVRVDLNRCVNSGDPEYLASAYEAREETSECLDGVQRAKGDEVLDEMIARARRGHERIFDHMQELLEEPAGDALAEQANDLNHELRNDLLLPARELLDYNREETTRDIERQKVIAERVGLGLLLLGACGAVAGMLVGFGIARGVSRSIVQLSLPIQDTAGKLNEVVGPITVASGSSLPELESILKTISTQTSAMVQRFRDAQREIDRAEQMAAIGQLAAGLAHELRNPLTSMKALVQLAAEDNEGLHGRDLGVLEEEIIRLEELTKTFLDFARPQRLERQRVDLAEVVDRTVEVASARAGQQGVQIDFEPPLHPAWLLADPTQMRQVLLNLLLNALDVMPSGGRVQLELRTENGRAILCCRDSGPGLPAGQEDKIFEPFFSTRETGMGLGLSICRRIVEAHGGTISASNLPEAGAEFRAVLPLCQPDAAPASAAAKRVPPAP